MGGRSLMMMPCPPIALAEPGSIREVWGVTEVKRCLRWRLGCEETCRYTASNASCKGIIVGVQPVECPEPL